MNRYLVIVCVAVVLVTLFAGLSYAKPSQLSHEDPSLAKPSLDTTALLLAYSEMFSVAAQRNYQSALSRLDSVKRAETPPHLRYMFEPYYALTGKLFDNLNKADSQLDEAGDRLARNRVGEARQVLDSAGAAVQEIQSLADQVQRMASPIGSGLGVPGASGEVTRAYSQLMGSLEATKQLTTVLAEEYDTASRQYLSKVSLLPTEVTVISRQYVSTFVGDSFSVSGTLSGQGEPMAGRTLTIVLGEARSTATTGADGTYTTTVGVPYSYTPRMTLHAEYVPTGSDTGRYRASRSAPYDINVLFHATTFESSVPDKAYPGLPAKIGIKVTSPGGNPRNVTAILDGTPFAEGSTVEQLTLEPVVPAQTALGKHILTLAVAPAGRDAGVSQNVILEVARMTLTVDVTVPGLAIVPGINRFSGQVNGEHGPVGGALVRLRAGGDSMATRTAGDGTFSVKLGIPPELALFGNRDVTISVEPEQPWYGSMTRQVSTPSLNLLSLALLLGLASVAVALYRRNRRHPVTVGGKPLPPVEAGLPAIAVLPPTNISPDSIEGKIMLAYTRGVVAVQAATRIPMSPQTTLREFLVAAVMRLPAISRLLGELTAMAEKTLYSTRIADGASAESAERLAARILEELNGRTA